MLGRPWRINGPAGLTDRFYQVFMRIRHLLFSAFLVVFTLACFVQPHLPIQAEPIPSSVNVQSPEQTNGGSTTVTITTTVPCIMGEWPTVDVKCGESKTITRPVVQQATDGSVCAPETKIVTGPPCPGCNDGVIQPDEDCDGDARLSPISRPTNVPVPVWQLRWCDGECNLRLPDYCGDGKLNGEEKCDWASAPGSEGHNAACTRECTLCEGNDSCGRPCGDPNYGQRNCCAGVPRPQEASMKKECKFRSKSTAGRGCIERAPYIYAYETRLDRRGRLIRDSNGDVKYFPLYTTRQCAWTGDELINGVRTGNLCDFWLDYLPDEFECRNKQEECTQVGVENQTGPIEVTTVSCTTGQLTSDPAGANCDPAKDWNCLEQTKWSCGSDQRSLETLWNTGETCEKDTPGCIAITHTVEGINKGWSKTESSYIKNCSQQLVGAAKKCRYAIQGGKRVEMGCETVSEGEWTPEVCSEWSLASATEQSGEEYIPVNSSVTKYVRAVEPLCTRTVVRGYANIQCQTTVSEEIREYEVEIRECKLVGDLYHKGRNTGEKCSGTSAPGDIGLTGALGNESLNNLFVKQCVQGNVEIPTDRALDRSNPWSLLNIEVQNQGYSLLGKVYSSGPEYVRDPLTQEICWTCAWIRYIGCFDPDTDITLANKTSKKVKDISVGDEVWNPVTKRASKVKDILESVEKQGMVVIEAGAFHLKVTQGHPVHVASKGNVVASALKVGDRLVTADGKEVAITKVETLAPNSSQRVINFTLEGSESFDDHMLIANGLVSGDLFVQKKLTTPRN